MSPELLLLNNGLKIKLIGIKEDPNKKKQAIEFLNKKTKGQKIFLKFDSIKYDKNDNLLCYVYLKNKTFINAHLIKNNLVNIDNTYDYSNKDRFLKYSNHEIN